MYRFLKKILYRVAGRQQLLKQEVFFRKIYSFFYSGSKHQCTICNKKLRKFIAIHQNDLLCPNCGSLSRDRRLWTSVGQMALGNGETILDFSPSRCLARKMKNIANVTYISTDLSGNFIADFQYDITNISLPENEVDIVICYHVLEHIDDDSKAMRELHRVMKIGAKGLVQTPFKEGDIYENPAITSPDDREAHFGQDDHVRIYSVNGLKSRLESAGFATEVKIFPEDLYHGLTSNETVVIITKV